MRERINDIPILVEHFLWKGSAKNQKAVISVSPEAISLLKGKEWHGNIRELENIVERSVLLAQEGTVTAEHILYENQGHSSLSKTSDKAKTVWEAERKLILETLEEMNGNRTHAAKALDISIRTLRNKLREYRESDSNQEKSDHPVGIKYQNRGSGHILNFQDLS